MITRSERSQTVPLNIVGSSTFGVYPKISLEKTYNMFISDDWLVDYAGYESVILAAAFGNAVRGRGIHTSTKFNRIVVVLDTSVYLVNIFFDQNQQKTFSTSVVQINVGLPLATSSGVVYISENNAPQIAISDGVHIYIYDTTASPTFQIATRDGTNPITFTPGYIDFQNNYFLIAASNDNFVNSGPAINNTWRLSASSNGLLWPDDPASQGFLQTKPDNTQAVIRFPSRGNLVFVMGETVTEPWYDVGYQIFPYQRSNTFSADYGCMNPATIASLDEFVVWLARNEKSGPIIVFSNGGAPEKVTTDGIDRLFSQMQNPADSRAFMYRQDGHLFYHINFYTDNLSLYIDFLPNGTQKIYHACDEHGNYFIADQVAFFNNQYYFITRNNGNLYAFDTIFTTYDGAEIPRRRICKPIRSPDQAYRVCTDVGFTIEQGETNPHPQDLGPIYLITMDGKKLITEGSQIFLQTVSGNDLVTMDGNNLVTTQIDNTDFDYLITTQHDIVQLYPSVGVSVSYDGAESFSSVGKYKLNPLGKRKNKLQFWNMGAFNDLTFMFEFWGLGRFVVTDGLANVRQ